MMKCVFVLVLLHLCVGAKSDTNLYMEIIDGLTKLEKYVTSVSAPTRNTSKNPNCLGTIQKELRNILNNVTVPTDFQNLIPELKGNLKELGDHEVNVTCKMYKQTPKGAVKKYIGFFQKLNTIRESKPSQHPEQKKLGSQ